MSADFYTLFMRSERFVKQYADAFIELAKQENLAVPNRKKLLSKLRSMKPDEIERIYDACCRFGIRNLT